jgi:DNA-binding MarR family transcriptional regulator
VHATNRQTLAERLWRLTTHLNRHSGTSAVALLDEVGVRPSQIKALQILAYADGPITISQLAALLNTSQPTASRTVASLARIGLVTTTVAVNDRRAREVAASEQGRDVIMRLAAARVRDLREFVDRLDGSAVKRLTAALDQIDFAADTESHAAGVAAA